MIEEGVTGPLRVLVVGEGDLSHGALARRLGAGLAAQERMEVAVHVVGAPRRLERLLVAQVPRLGDIDLQPLRWRARYSWRARLLLRRHACWADVALINTQSCALLARSVMDELPTVLSVDVTGRQFAALQYWRPRTSLSAIGERPLERLERRAYLHARHVIAWTEWTARSLRDDYGVGGDRLSVLHLGVELGDPPGSSHERDGAAPLRLLFVANSLQRKGLDLLLAAVSRMRHLAEIDVVTADALEPRPGLRVHHGIPPRSPELRARFAAADAFVLPTRADAAPWVILEAMAAGVPVVASEVGAIPELLGGAGLLHRPGDVAELTRQLDQLADAPDLRASLAFRARRRVEERYDERIQFRRLADLLRDAGYSG